MSKRSPYRKRCISNVNQTKKLFVQFQQNKNFVQLKGVVNQVKILLSKMNEDVVTNFYKICSGAAVGRWIAKTDSLKQYINIKNNSILVLINFQAKITTQVC